MAKWILNMSEAKNKIFYIERESKAPLLLFYPFYITCIVLLMTNNENRLLAFPNACFWMHSSNKRSPTKRAVSRRLILVKYSSDTQTSRLQRYFACFAVSTRNFQRILLTLRCYFGKHICLSQIYKSGILLNRALSIYKVSNKCRQDFWRN